MQLNWYRDQIKNQLTGFGLLESELDDSAWDKVVEASLQELLHYYSTTCFVETPYSSCIDLTELEKTNNIKINNVVSLFRSKTIGTGSGTTTSWVDPMSMAMWQAGGSYYNMNRFTYDYLAYTQMQQIANTLSTDLAFREDVSDHKLYINDTSQSTGGDITIEYIPRIESVEQIKGEFWIDTLVKLALAHAKIALGRVRTRFKQSNALWTDDGETMLTEGKEELKAIRETLEKRNETFYPVD